MKILDRWSSLFAILEDSSASAHRARPRTSHTSSLPLARFRRSNTRKKALALPFQFSLLPGVSAGVSAARNPIAAGQPSHAHVALLSLSIFYLQYKLLYVVHLDRNMLFYQKDFENFLHEWERKTCCHNYFHFGKIYHVRNSFH